MPEIEPGSNEKSEGLVVPEIPESASGLSPEPAPAEHAMPVVTDMPRKSAKRFVYPVLTTILLAGMLGNGALYINQSSALNNSQDQINSLKAELASLSGQGTVVDFTSAVTKIKPSIGVIEATVQTIGFFGQ